MELTKRHKEEKDDDDQREAYYIKTELARTGELFRQRERARRCLEVGPWWAPSRLPVVARHLTDLAPRGEQRVFLGGPAATVGCFWPGFFFADHKGHDGTASTRLRYRLGTRGGRRHVDDSLSLRRAEGKRFA